MKNDSIARKPVSNTAPAEPSNSEGSDDPFDATECEYFSYPFDIPEIVVRVTEHTDSHGGIFRPILRVCPFLRLPCSSLLGP